MFSVDNCYAFFPSPPPTDECVRFLSELAGGLNLPVTVVHLDPERPVVIITLLGTNPELPSVLLNSHMDVVPVFPVSTTSSVTVWK